MAVGNYEVVNTSHNLPATGSTPDSFEISAPAGKKIFSFAYTSLSSGATQIHSIQPNSDGTKLVGGYTAPYNTTMYYWMIVAEMC